MDIAVIIPCYNSAHFVGETVESVLRQTHAPAEIIVVNDGSTDASGEVLRSFGSRIRVLDQPNRGVAAARNAGIRATSARWVALLDHDDRFEPDYLAGMQSLHAAFPQAQMLFSDFSEFTDEEIVMPSAMDRYVPDLLATAEKTAGDLLYFGRKVVPLIIQSNGAFLPSCLVMDRQVFNQAGGFCEQLRGSDDLDFYMQTLPTTRVGVIKRQLVSRRNHPTQLHRQYAPMRSDLKILCDRAEDVFRRNCPELLPLVRKKRCGLLQIFGRAEMRKGDYAAAQTTFAELVRAKPLSIRNWSRLITATIRCCMRSHS